MGAQAPIRNDDDDDVPVLRIVLVGKTGSGKSATGNTILGSEYFVSEFSPVSVTSSCKEASGVGAFRQVSVVDTPGLFDTRISEDEILKKIGDCIRLAAPGPHAFLIVIKLERFTAEEQRSVEIIQKVFGQKSNEYTMVLFTNGDQLKGKSAKDFLKKCPGLQELVSTCNGRYHVFNNEAKDPSQVHELLEKIRQMVEKNGGSHYNNEMFQEAARKMQEEKESKLKAEEAEREKLREEGRQEVRMRKVGEEEERMRKVREEEEERMRKVRKEKERKRKVRKEKERMRKVRVLTTTTGALAAAGGAIATGIAAVQATSTGGVVAMSALAAASPIGILVGGAIGLGIGGGYLLYQYLRDRNRVRGNTSEETELLIK